MEERIRKLYEEKTLGLSSVENARQLGGYIGAEGRRVKDGVLLRSAQLNTLSDEEAALLAQRFGVSDIVDFRTTQEREQIGPDRPVSGAQNHQIHVMDDLENMNLGHTHGMDLAKNADLIDAMIAYVRLKGGIRDLYGALGRAEISWHGYRAFFDVLLRSRGAVLWHCTMGKDRAGFAAVLLLSALGVDRETILDDYEASNICYKDKVSGIAMLLDARGVDGDVKEECVGLFGVSRSAMVWLLDIIDNEFGGMQAFLRGQIGLTDQELAQLQAKYLA